MSPRWGGFRGYFDHCDFSSLTRIVQAELLSDLDPLGDLLHEVVELEIAILFAFELSLFCPNFRCHMVEAISDDVVDKIVPVEVEFFMLLRRYGLRREEKRKESDVTFPVLAFQLGTGGSSTEGGDGGGIRSAE